MIYKFFIDFDGFFKLNSDKRAAEAPTAKQLINVTQNLLFNAKKLTTNLRGSTLIEISKRIIRKPGTRLGDFSDIIGPNP